jgi:thioredoxin 2
LISRAGIALAGAQGGPSQGTAKRPFHLSLMADAQAKVQSLVIACPTDGTLNRVPEDRLSARPRCGKCGDPLFRAEPLVLTAGNFDRHASKSDLPLLIDFWAAWCGPCRTMAPAFAQAASSLEPRLRLGKLDTEAEPALAACYRIQSIPSLVLIRKGREVARTAGAMPASAIVQWAEQALAGV